MIRFFENEWKILKFLIPEFPNSQIPEFSSFFAVIKTNYAPEIYTCSPEIVW